MTAQEEQMIQELAERINNTSLSEKDPDAEQLLQQQLGRNPDALYILAQTTLVQQYALEQAQKQLADARAQLEQQKTQQPKHTTSFLGSLLGRGDDQPRTPPPPPVQQGNQQGWVPVQQYGPTGGYPPPPPMYGQPGYGPAPGYAPQSGGFLRSAMQTATGVAAGALAFEGIESLMHGFGGGGGFGSGGGRPEEIINNYYGDSGREHERPLSSDIDDRRGDSSSFSDAVDRDDHGTDDFAAAGSDADDLNSGSDTTDTGDGLDDGSNFDDGSSMDDLSGSDDSGF